MDPPAATESTHRVIRTPDQRLRVFVSSTLRELAAEREAAREAIESLRMSPILFELGARPHPAQDLYRAYLQQSHIFIGLYWQRYGWVAPDMEISGLEDEYRLARRLPKLIYIKTPAPDREPALKELLRDIKEESDASYKYFSTSAELRDLVANDLALLLTERFEQSADGPVTQLEAVEVTGEQPALSQLPLLPTLLFGREKSAATLEELLLDERARLVSLLGPGGVGKTSLALQVARNVATAFADGVYWVPLATIRDPELVLSAIARALDVRERAGTELIESVKGYLQDRDILLLLDNFEQVVGAAPIVGELLAAAEKLQVLVTSRAPLQLRGERELPLDPLRLPEVAAEASLEQARANPAVALFVERARAVLPSFELDAANVAVVSEVVRRLDGLPLAIELAAARSKLLSPTGMLERMDSRLGLLTGGARDLPARQQTLRNTIEWSFDLLDEQSKVLFRRLAVFAGGFTLDEAEAVVAGGNGADVLGGVQTLLDNSLLRGEIGAGRAQRFLMLQTIREYALERLREAGEEAETRRLHADAYAALVEKAWTKMFSGASEAWLDRLEAEYSNLRAALQWHYDAGGDVAAGRNIIVYLVWFWYRRGYLNEARQWYRRAIEEAPPDDAGGLGALLLGHAGSVAMWQSDLHAAGRLMDESIGLLREQGLSLALGDVLFTRGVLAVNQGDDKRAQAVLEEALAVMKELEQAWFAAMIVLHLGNVALNRGRVAEAEAQMREALETGRQVGDRWIVASAINNLGEIARYRQELDDAERNYRESMELFRSVGSTPDVARADHSLAYVALWRDDYVEAAELFEQSLGLYQQVGVKRGIVECLNGMAALAAMSGQKEAARRMVATARAQFAALGAGVWPADRMDVARLTGLAAPDDQAGAAPTLEEALAEGRRLLREVSRQPRT